MADVDNLYAYYQSHTKTIYCILSKETARNGYMRKPSVRWNPVRKGFECPHCGYIQEMTVFDGEDSYLVNADANFFLNENNRNHKCQNKQCRQPLWGIKDLKGKAGWEIVMIGRKRKTMALCHACHDKLHAGKLD